MVAAAPFQKELPLAALGRKRPLADLLEVSRRLGWSEDTILAAIDNGQLRYAWDISSKDAQRRYIRVLAASLDALEFARPQPNLVSDPETFIFPHTRDTLRTADLTWSFNCRPTHILDLLREGLLTLSPHHSATHHSANSPSWRRGPNGSPHITRDSVLAFLKSRRIQ